MINENEFFDGLGEPDEFGDCYMFAEDGFWVCMAVGSEDCDCCPNYGDIGEPVAPQGSGE